MKRALLLLCLLGCPSSAPAEPVDSGAAPRPTHDGYKGRAIQLGEPCSEHADLYRRTHGLQPCLPDMGRKTGIGVLP